MKPSDQIKELPPPPSDTATIKAGRDWLREAARRGAECPCCRRYTKFYERKLHAAMAMVLVRWYRHNVVQKRDNEWLHVEKWLFEQKDLPSSLRGDWHKLRFWGLIEEKPSENKTGLWRITPQGVDFVLGGVMVQSSVMVYDNKAYAALQTKDQTLIGIKDALGSKFKYDELMRGEF